MNNKLKSFLNNCLITVLLLAVIAIAPHFAYAISSNAEDTMFSETQLNNGWHLSGSNNVSAASFGVENFEIPLSLLKVDLAKDRGEAYLNSLVFYKKGVPYVRWIIHPLDTRWVVEIEKWLKANNVSTERSTYYTAYRTASRSIYLVDPETNVEFSLKTSTNIVTKNQASKAEPWRRSQDARLISDYLIDRLQSIGPAQNFILLDEPLAIGMFGLIDGSGYSSDLGMTIRSYSPLIEGENRYVPVFSILHTHYGAQLAKENGSDNPAEYWNEHCNKPIARALAELFAKTGILHESPHSQNLLVELDKNNRPTGRIIIRDLADVILSKEYFKAIGKEDIYLKYVEGDEISNKPLIRVDFAIFTNLWSPKWLNRTGKKADDPSYYETWAADHFKEFESEFKKQTGVALERAKTPLKRYTDGFILKYKKNTGFKEFYKKLGTNSSQKCVNFLTGVVSGG